MPAVPQVIGAPVPVTITGINFGGVMQLSYIYEPGQDVPEPAGVALVAIALALFATRRRPRTAPH